MGADILLRIAALIYQLIIGQITIQTALERLVNGLQQVALEHQPYAIETIASNGTNTVNHPTWGNHALLTAIQAITPPSGPTIQNVLDAIAALPAGSGLTVPSSSDNAAAVWGYIIPFSGGAISGTLLNYAGWFAKNFGDNQMSIAPFSPHMLIQGNWWDYSAGSRDGYAPTGDWTDIQPDDTRLTWLLRTESFFNWALDPTGLYVYADRNPSSPDGRYYIFSMTEAQFQQQKHITTTNLPPVWPGLANVVLGAPVALSDGLVVTGPLHGVLIDCATAPPGASEWVLGAEHAFYRWGEVSFVTDNGESEPFQFLGFGLGVYLPRTMAIASSAILRVSRLPTATVTPFTII